MSEGTHDVVARLERLQADCERLYGSAPLLPIAVAADARDEILALSTDLSRMREALEEITGECEADFTSSETERGPSRCDDDESVAWDFCKLTFGTIRRARAALSPAAETKA